jgi:hypothetical protein
LTKRLAGIALAAAAAASFALPAAPAQAAGCVSPVTTPVECAKELLVAGSPALPDCVYYGTFPLVCLPPAST